MTQLDMVIQIIRLKWVQFVVSVIIFCHKITTPVHIRGSVVPNDQLI